MKFYLSAVLIIIEAEDDLSAKRKIASILHQLEEGNQICDWKIYKRDFSDPAIDWSVQRSNPLNIGEIDSAIYQSGTGFDFANYSIAKKIGDHVPMPYSEWIKNKEYM